MELHNSIINSVAKKAFQPEGLFRVGSTRTWIEDNGYYFTIVCFEPSQFSKGTYLSVGISFMWGLADETDTFLGIDIGGREISNDGSQYIEYQPHLKDCDSIFEKGVTAFAEAAIIKVDEYRRYQDLEYAKNRLIEISDSIPPDRRFWELYRIAMLCFFMGDQVEGKIYFKEFLNSFGRIEHSDELDLFYQYCARTLIPLLDEPQTARQMVYDRINNRRAIFSDKKSYKGLRKDTIFQ